MIISVINHTHIPDAEVQRVIRAINRQIAEDFEPYWSLGATLRLEGKVGRKPNHRAVDMRGDGVIYLWDDNDIDGALGYHDLNYRGIPYGFVFTELSQEYGEDWTVTLSHEALEIIGDPDVNLLVMGPHPDDPNRDVFHWYEMCDAVQAETYEIDGVNVSNFVLPLYFTDDEELRSRNDFLGTVYDGKSLPSFGVNRGGYVGFYDPEIGKHDTFSMKDDARAAYRLKTKAKAGPARRAIRYTRYSQPERSKL